MTSWVTHEMQASNMPDERLKKRLTKIVTNLRKNAEESIPAACQGWGEIKGVYRFLDNRRVGLDKILSGHKAATIERISKELMVVLLSQDTTFIDLGTEKEAGIGTLQSLHFKVDTTILIVGYWECEIPNFLFRLCIYHRPLCGT